MHTHCDIYSITVYVSVLSRKLRHSYVTDLNLGWTEYYINGIVILQKNLESTQSECI